MSWIGAYGLDGEGARAPCSRVAVGLTVDRSFPSQQSLEARVSSHLHDLHIAGPFGALDVKADDVTCGEAGEVRALHPRLDGHGARGGNRMERVLTILFVRWGLSGRVARDAQDDDGDQQTEHRAEDSPGTGNADGIQPGPRGRD